MAKTAAKNGIVLINGYSLSTFVTAYEATVGVDPVEVTGLTDQSHNFLPGQRTSELSLDMLWSSTVGHTHTALGSVTTGQVTLIPEGYTLGAQSLSMPFMQATYGPQGDPASAIKLGSIKFQSYGSGDVAQYPGVMLAHASITNTTTGTGVADPSAAPITAACGATLHIWGATSSDTYVIKVQHSTALGSGYADLITFTADGKTLTAERQTVASGTVNTYRRVVATRTGAAGDTLSYSVHFYTV